MNDNKIKQTIAHLVTLLVDRKYSEVVHLTNGVRLQVEHIQDAINRYGRILVAPPDKAYENLDILKVDDDTSQKWSVRFDLWTIEEGRSDLSIELTLIEVKGEKFKIELDNIHSC